MFWFVAVQLKKSMFDLFKKLESYIFISTKQRGSKTLVCKSAFKQQDF